MASRNTSAIHERIQDLAQPIRKLPATLSTESSASASVPTTKDLLQSMPASASEIESLAKDFLEPQFNLFPMVPLELRLKIWKMALPGPRIVEVYLDPPENPVTQEYDIYIRVNTPPPAVMHVNFESRQVALEKYWLLLGNKGIKHCFAQIDPAEDTIFIPWPKSYTETPQHILANGTFWSEEARESIRSLAMDQRSWEACGGPGGFVYFERLEKFTIVAHDRNWREKCVEEWRMSETELAFIDLDDKERVHDHRLSVESQMQFDNEYYGRQWGLPVIEVKALVRGGKKCCFN
jgi:hypothetical protein